MHFTALDAGVLALYLIGMVVVGWWTRGKISTTKDYIVAGRQLSWLVVMATLTASWWGGGATIGRVGRGYEIGMSLVWTVVGYVIGVLILTLLAPLLWKADVYTMPGLVEKRYGEKSGLLASILVAFFSITGISMQLVAIGTVFGYIGAPLGITPQVMIFAGAIILIAYTYMGGLYAVAYTDIVQVIILLIGLVVVAPVLAVRAAGGWSAVVAAVPANAWNPITSSPVSSWAPLFWTWLFGGVTEPYQWQRLFAAKDARSARKAILWSGLATVAFCVVMVFLGIVARALYKPEYLKTFKTNEVIVPLMAVQLFPPIITGLVIAALTAAMMSTADSTLLIAANTVVYDIVQKYKRMSEEESVRWQRYMVIVLGLSGAYIALFATSVFSFWVWRWNAFCGSMLLPIAATILWKRATKLAVNAGMVAGFLGGVYWAQIIKAYPWVRSMALNSQIVFAGIVSGAAILLVSLLTRPDDTLPIVDQVRSIPD